MHAETQHGPGVWLLGDLQHPDFAEAVALLQSTAQIGPGLPELIVFVQSRPGAIGAWEIERLRRSAPLAGVVLLVGSWCEGEPRTGKPLPGVERLYWYQFSSWWRRQWALWAAGRCPEWGLPPATEGRSVRNEERVRLAGKVAIETARWDTLAALSDVLQTAGCDAMWVRPAAGQADFCGVCAGIWEGGQLSDAEAEELAAFAAQLRGQHAPVVALLDFPRRDRCAAARRAGAGAVLGKPWLNADLLATLQRLMATEAGVRMPNSTSAA